MTRPNIAPRPLSLLGAEDDDLGAAPAGLVDDRLAHVPGTHDAGDHADAVLAPERRRLAQLGSARSASSAIGSASDRVSGTWIG